PSITPGAGVRGILDRPPQLRHRRTLERGAAPGPQDDGARGRERSTRSTQGRDLKTHGRIESALVGWPPRAPPLDEYPAILRDASAASRRLALMVLDDAARHHGEMTAKVSRRAKAEVDVLHAIDEDRVESAQEGNLGGAHHQCGSCDGGELELVRSLCVGHGVPSKEVDGKVVLTEEDRASRLDRVVRINEERLGS